MRLKKRGISTTQILERKQIEDDYGGEMPTALMEKLLENGGRGAAKAKKAVELPNAEAWDLNSFDGVDSNELGSEGSCGQGFDDEDDSDEDNEEESKIPKKTEIFSGKVV